MVSGIVVVADDAGRVPQLEHLVSAETQEWDGLEAGSPALVQNPRTETRSVRSNATIAAPSAPSSRPASEATSAMIAWGGEPAATAVATRRSEDCSSASSCCTCSAATARVDAPLRSARPAMMKAPAAT